MLVRDAGDCWQLVLQPDHADLSGQLARAWGGQGFAAPEPFDSVVLAATRHDDGWAVWERRPRLGPDGTPQSFFTVPVPVHLAFYRAGVEVVRDEDPYAGLLVSMHMSGLYRGRYGVMPGGPSMLEGEARSLADAFCEQEEARQQALAAELEADDAQRWTNYALLQVFDVVSLYFGLSDLEAGTEGTFEGAPTAGGGRTRLTIAPLGPRRVRFDPFPFHASPTVLTLARRLVPKRAWSGDDEFRRDFDAAAVETLRIVVER
jgi:Protein of unknown function (DUF3891)